MPIWTREAGRARRPHSCCRRSTTRRPNRHSRRWRASSRWLRAPNRARRSSCLRMTPASFVPPATSRGWRRKCAPCWTRQRAAAWVPTPAVPCCRCPRPRLRCNSCCFIAIFLLPQCSQKPQPEGIGGRTRRPSHLRQQEVLQQRGRRPRRPRATRRFPMRRLPRLRQSQVVHRRRRRQPVPHRMKSRLVKR